MKSTRVMVGVAAILLILVLVQGVQAGTYGYVTKWGTHGNYDGQFNMPWGVAVDSNSNVYVCDHNNQRVQAFDSVGNFKGKLSSISCWGIAVDGSNNVYKAGGTLQKYSFDGTNFNLQWSTFLPDDGPEGIDVDSSGNIYVAFWQSNEVQKFDSSGNLLFKWGDYGTGDKQFDSPHGLAVDTAGNVYVADSANNRIQKFDSSGTYLGQWSINSPEGVAVDSADNVFVTDEADNKVMKFDSSGNLLAEWGSVGTGDGEFSGAVGLAVDTAGNVYVAEYWGDRIQKFAPTVPSTCNNVILDTVVTLPGTYNMDLDTGTVIHDPSSDVWWRQMTSTTRQMEPEGGASIVNLGIMDDSAFTAITADDLATYTYSSDPIRGDDNPPLNQAIVGDVFAVHTNIGNYAKAKILSKSPHNPPPLPVDIITLHLVVYSCTGGTGSITADYTVDTYFGAKPLTVAFTDISKGVPNPPTSVTLEFGDGESADIDPGTTVSHTYSSPGNYKPVITACYGDVCDSQTKATITVIYPNLDKGLVDACKLTLDEKLNGNAVDKLMFGQALPTGPKTLTLFRGETFELPEDEGYLISIDYFPQANYKHKVVFAYVSKTVPMVILKIIEASSPSTNYADPILIAGVPSDPAGFIPGPTLTTASSNSLTGGGGGTESPTLYQALDSIPMCSTPDCSHNYALLLSGGVQKEYNYARYRNDIEFLYTTLTEKYGYPKSHITVLMSDGTNTGEDQIAYWTDNDPNYANSITDFDGDGIPEVKDGAVTRTNVLNTLETLRSTLTKEDNLFIFTTNHGDLLTDPSETDPLVSKEVILYLWGTGDDGWITDADFVNALPGSPDYPGTGIKSITMVMEQCYGGGFIDNFIGQYHGDEERVIATAAAWNELSWGNAYSYQWISGVDANRYSMLQAHENAKENDYYRYNFQPPKENPQFSSNFNDGTTRYLNDCPVTPPTPSITVEEPGTTTWYTGQTRDIIWTQAGLSGKTVNIELWKGTPGTIVPLVPPQIATVTLGNELTGTKKWTIPSTLASGRDYWIKIYQADAPDVFGRSEGSLTINKVRAGTSTTGKLWINSTPVPTQPGNVGGAMIYIDGKLQKDANGANILTNASFTLSSGTHDVGVERAGYYAVETTPVDVPLSGTKEKNFPLELIPPPPIGGTANDCVPLGTMEIRSTPVQHAKITILENNIEITWLKDLYTDTKTKIPPGTYTVKVEHDEFLTATQTGVEIVKPDCTDDYRDRRDVIVAFKLTSIDPVKAKVLILPQPLNIGKTGYFAAIVTLKGEKAADVDAGTVTCNDAKALTLLRDAKWFPQTFVAIFSRQDLDPTQTGTVTMTVEGSIKKSGGNPMFRESNKILVTNKKTTAKEAIDDWKKMTPLQFITIFFR